MYEKIVYTSDNPKLDYRVILKRLKNRDFSYILGRFLLVRKTYSLYKRMQQIIFSPADVTRFSNQIENESTLNAKEISRQIDQNSYFDQLKLSDPLTTSIVNFAKTKNLVVRSSKLSLTYQKYKEQDNNSLLLATAHLEDPLAILEIQRLRWDDFLLRIAEEYLGYYPQNCDVAVWWSFANAISPAERRQQLQTIDFHYDIHGFNFFYVCFYLTDVNTNSGAHVLVKGSHKHKQMSMLLRSARCSDAMIQQQYSDVEIITIEGKAGKCFLEDASCFHKALPPVENDRLFLQLRYF